MTNTQLNRQAIAQAAAYVHELSGQQPRVGIILGSGLADLVGSVDEAMSVPYSRIPHFVPSTVEGHKGELVIGKLGAQSVAVMNGRLHYYEGYTPQQVTFPVRVLRELGCTTLIVTNAAGGLNPDFQIGDLMLITDHINIPGLAGLNPLVGPNDAGLGPRFPDLHDAYSRELRGLVAKVAASLGLTLREGVYVMLGGPSFETPAEVRFLRAMGGDAVGMSTAAEVVVARHAGLRVLGISMISNVLSPELEAPPVAHDEVLAAGAIAMRHLAPLIRAIVERL
jgi:purine-nucleoside phosphorylase